MKLQTTKAIYNNGKKRRKLRDDADWENTSRLCKLSCGKIIAVQCKNTLQQ
jgi:hypothetical protein